MSSPLHRPLQALLLSTALVGVAAPQLAHAQVYDGLLCAPKTEQVTRSPNVMLFVDRSGSMGGVSGENTTPLNVTTDVTTTGTTDNGLELIPSNHPDNPQARRGLSLSKKVSIPKYAWIANHGHNSVSKFDMEDFKEVGRYWAGSNPSRTTIDGDGNAWVGARNNGVITKIISDSDSCPDANGDGVITTSREGALGPLNYDECVVYRQAPTSGWTGIRGLAAGPDGRIWFGYNTNGGGIRSINKNTFALGPLIQNSSITVPTYTTNSNGTINALGTRTGQNACGVYGLTLDSQGLMYLSNTCRERLPVYDTKLERWHAMYYTGGTNYRGTYGVTVDGDNRVWLGSYNHGTGGVRMFDPNTNRWWAFTSNKGMTTGVAVEPATGDVWTSFYQTGWTGRLKFNPANPGASTWVYIPTTKTSYNGGNLSGVGNDLRGVGFDTRGYAWTVGLASNKVFKLDPATNARATDLPNGAAVGVGTHYTYSDFTGSVFFSFTAPSGKWRKVYNLGTSRVDSFTVEAHVPQAANLGVRYRMLSANDTPVTDWIPAEANGSATYNDYPVGASSHTFPIPQPNDKPFSGYKLEVEARLSSGDKNVRPVLYSVSFNGERSTSAWENAQDIATELSNASTVPGGCSSDDLTGCDQLQVGLGYFDTSYTGVVSPGENTGGSVTTSIQGTQPIYGALTDLAELTTRIKTIQELRDEARDNYAVLITDGRENDRNRFIQAVDSLCQAQQRNKAPVNTFVIGLGPTSNEDLNGMLAAAGGTGYCCNGNSTACAESARIDICAYGNLPSALTQGGAAPYSEVRRVPGTIACTGSRDVGSTTALKNDLRDLAKEAACTLPLEIPRTPMYDKPTFPQEGALENPNATKVTIKHKEFGLVELPYCDPDKGSMDCGLYDLIFARTNDATYSERFRHSGWAFADAKRSAVKLTGEVCEEMARRKILKATTQLSCQCPLEGKKCTVPGATGRCAPGHYICNAKVEDECVSDFKAVPEICNGLDDNCDGGVDNLKEATGEWRAVGGLPQGYEGAACYGEDVCACPDGVGDHLGKGESLQTEIGEYLGQSKNLNTCFCVAGLTNDQASSASAASTDDSTDSVPGCSAAPSQRAPSGLALLGLLAGCALLRRRRR